MLPKRQAWEGGRSSLHRRRPRPSRPVGVRYRDDIGVVLLCLGMELGNPAAQRIAVARGERGAQRVDPGAGIAVALSGGKRIPIAGLGNIARNAETALIEDRQVELAVLQALESGLPEP